MKVHLIRSKGYPIEDFNNVMNLLNKHQGSIEFVPSVPIVLPESEREEIYNTKIDFEKKAPPPVSMSRDLNSLHFEARISFPHKANVLTWEQLFNVCNKYRKENFISNDDYVILLNDIPNEKNWFASTDHSMKNMFIQTNDWDWYFGSGTDDRFPISYEIAAWLLRSLMFRSPIEVYENVHKNPRGCMMDFCEDKTQIILKMRTGDLCMDCMKTMEKRDINRNYARQLFQIMDGLRENIMFRQRSILLRQLSRMEIRGYTKSIFLTDLGDLQINLNPKERALYLLYLNHPEGIRRSHLIDYREELRSFYGQLSSQSSNELIDLAVNRLVDVTDNNMNEVMARIRSKFKQAVGEEQAKDYSITSTPEGTHRILFNRELLSFAE
ncbi:MAG: hypothetical protein ACKO7P_07130 [Bacteroidota bacterium]